MAPSPIIFLGTSAFAVPSLKALASDPDFAVRLVVTQPDKPVGRKETLTPSPVKVASQSLHLPLLQPANVNKELPTYLRTQNIDVDFLVVVAYGQILEKALLILPRIAPLNVHASLLPRWRGASPIQHAIIAGDRETGITIQWMVDQVDAGPILAQERFSLSLDATTASLTEKLSHRGALLLRKTLKNPLITTPQTSKGLSICSKLSRKDGMVNPTLMTAEAIDRRFRALTPWPGVTCPVRGHTLKLLKSSLIPDPQSLPLPCAQASLLYLQSVQEPGKNSMSGKEWAQGHGGV